VNDLKGELASLRIERDRPVGNPWRWPVLLLIPAALLIGFLYVLRIRAALQAVEIDTVHASVQQQGAPSAGTPILTASGYVVARRKAVVSAKIQGRLSELAVEEGSHVVRGDVIARLESADYEAQLLRARAAVQHAEADLEEQKRQLLLTEKLAQAEVASQDQLAAAKSRVRLAEAALAQAQADLSFADATLQNTQIRAPFTGVVVKKMAEVGESVAPIPPGVNISTSSGAIVALADLATLEVEADVSESNVAKLGDNQPAEVTVEAFPDRKYKGVLRQIIPTADRTKATVQVKVTILDKDKDLKPEMSAKVTFLESKAVQSGPAEPVVTVPKEAIVERGGKSVVLEVREGRVHERPIVISDERQGRVGIRSGLTGSETLVAHPPEALKEGDRVRVKG
jgi:HlyD family secretion protein